MNKNTNFFFLSKQAQKNRYETGPIFLKKTGTVEKSLFLFNKTTTRWAPTWSNPRRSNPTTLKFSVKKMQGIEGQRIQEIKLETEENSRVGNNGRKKIQKQRHMCD